MWSGWKPPDKLGGLLVRERINLPAPVRRLLMSGSWTDKKELTYQEIKINPDDKPSAKEILRHSNGYWRPQQCTLAVADLFGYVHAHGLRAECLFMANTMVPEPPIRNIGFCAAKQ